MRAVACVLLAACGGGGKSAVPVGSRVGPAITAALAAADTLATPWRCAAPDGPTTTDETIKLGDRTWTLSKHTLRRDGDGEIVIGAIADAGGAAPATIAALGRLRTKLERTDVVIALGGMGTTQAELEATLGALADKAKYPIVAVPGDLENTRALVAAIAAMRAKNQIVIDGRLANRIELSSVTIAAIGGAGAASRLVAGGEGCAYTARDVVTLMTELAARPGIRVLATSEAPRIVVAGEPSGERALTAGAGQGIDIALHGPVTEAATRAHTGQRTGDAVALTPGTADATTRLPGPARAPTVGILTVRGGSWRWKPIADD